MSNYFNAYFLALMIGLGSLLSGSVSASPTSNDIPQTPEHKAAIYLSELGSFESISLGVIVGVPPPPNMRVPEGGSEPGAQGGAEGGAQGGSEGGAQG